MFEGNKQSEKKKRLSRQSSLFSSSSSSSAYCLFALHRREEKERIIVDFAASCSCCLQYICSCLIFVRNRSAYHRRTCIQWARRTTCQRHTDNATIVDVCTGQLMMMRCWWHFGRVVDWLATNTFTSRKRRNIVQERRESEKKRQNGDGGL